MSNKTKNLELHKWDLTNSEDLKSQFDIEKSLNENWDKIDKAIGNSDALINALIAENKSYKSQIPLGTATGESITLNDSSDLPVQSVRVKGKTYQKAREGYNLISPALLKNNASIDIQTGEEIATGNRTITTDFIAIEPTVSYYFVRPVAKNNAGFRFYDEEYQYIGSGEAFTDKSKIFIPFEITNNESTKFFKFIDEGNTLNEGYMLCKSETELEYEQYGVMPSIEYPAEIESVTGDVEVKVRNKNLHKPSLTRNGTNINVARANVTLENDVYSFECTGTDMYLGAAGVVDSSYSDIHGQLIDISKFDEISINLTNPLFTHNFITQWSEDLVSLGYTNITSNTGTVSKVDGAKYMTLRFGIASPTTGTTYSTKVQLEGGLVSDYIEHEEQNYPISLGENEIFEDGYIAIEYDENTGYKTLTKASIVNNYGKYVMDGTTNKFIQKHSSLYTETNGFYQFRITDKKIGESSGFTGFKCNYLKPHQGTASSAKNYDCLWWEGGSSSTAIYMYASIPFLTLDEANAWLQELNTVGNPLEIVYPLEIPVETEITDETLLSQLEVLINAETYKNITHIDGKGETLNPNIEVVYKKDLETLFNNLNTAVVALGGM